MLKPGTVLHHRYRIDRLLGKGGMGTVYQAFDERLETVVALKETHSVEEEFRKAFQREARILATLKHGALPKVIDHFGDEFNQYLVMEYISGQNLKELQDRQATLISLDQVLHWAETLLDALEYLHTHQPPIIHRDIKPQNIKLTTDGKIVLLDFGLAKHHFTEASQSIHGFTTAFAPIEQIQGISTDARSDIFSLGATLYRLMTGQLPSNAEVRNELVKQGAFDPLQLAHTINSQIPPALSLVLRKAMALKREDRYPNVVEFRRALQQVDRSLISPPAQNPARRIQIDISPPPVPSPLPPPAKTPLFGKIKQFLTDSFGSKSKPNVPSADSQSRQGQSEATINPQQLSPQLDSSVQSKPKKPNLRPVPKEESLSEGDILKELYRDLKADTGSAHQMPKPQPVVQPVHPTPPGFEPILAPPPQATHSSSAAAETKPEPPAAQTPALSRKPKHISSLNEVVRAEPVVSPPNFAVPSTEDFDTPGSAVRRLLREKLAQKQRQNLQSFTDEPVQPAFEPPPTPTPRRPTGGSDTRQLIAEAKAAAEARQTAEARQATEVRPVFDPMPEAKAKPDPKIEKMVGSAHIVRHQTGEHRRDTLEQAKSSMMAPAAPKPPLSRTLGFGGTPRASGYQKPSILMLEVPPPRQEQEDAELWDRAQLLAEKCREFNVTGKIENIHLGPVVTTFEFKPDPGVKYSRVANLTDDLCLVMKAVSVRIDRLPGKSTIGIQVSNAKREVIFLREIVESEEYLTSTAPLMVALGKTIEGDTYASDLAKMPHLLIAGTTGSGKSVMVNALICSILLRATPSDVKMIMVDTKRVELGLYEGIPHLLTQIIVDPKCAANALNWVVREMETRYKQLANFGVRNISQFNHEICGSGDVARFGLSEPPPKLPYLVIVIDDLADLMMVASSEVETAITRLAQMARAVGIHLVVTTQRPSANVITGLIKANFLARMSFRVSSKVDSRTILDANGAECLLEQGDMLFLPPGRSSLTRIHGAYVSEVEINRIVDHVKAQGRPQYNDSIQRSEDEGEGGESSLGERDELYDDAMRIIVQMGRASTSVLQRRLSIGYGRAAKILDMMEIEGYVGPSEGGKPREVKRIAVEYVEMLDGYRLNGDD